VSDKYPSTLAIEIDRTRLRNYLRARWLLSWVLPLSFCGILFGLVRSGKALEHGVVPRDDIVLLIVRCFGATVGISLLVAVLLYLIFSHRLASRIAASLEVSVEGAFLRVRQHSLVLTDRKLHFRSIVDYATTQDCLMRYFGIHALCMTTTGGGQNANVIVPGVKDCLGVRDLLADIDQLRENQ